MLHMHELSGLKNSLPILQLDSKVLWDNAPLWLAVECKSAPMRKLMLLEVIL